MNKTQPKQGFVAVGACPGLCQGFFVPGFVAECANRRLSYKGAKFCQFMKKGVATARGDLFPPMPWQLL